MMIRKTLSLTAVALGILFTLPSMLYADHWTAVASSGTVDESAAGFFALNPTTLGYLPGSMSVNPIVARYNVTNTTGAEIAPWNVLELGYFDNANLGQVTAQFFEVDRCTGARTLICGVTSVNNAAAACVVCNFQAVIDFSQFLYYVEVTVARGNAAALPTANTLRIF